MTLDVSNIVKVSASIAPQGLLRKEFGITLFLTHDNTLPTGAGRVGVYASFADVAAIFDETSEPYKAARAYFQQSPYPKNLIIARWINEDAPAIFYGSRAAGLDDLKAVTSGSLEVNGEAFTGLDFSGALSYADIADVLQEALRAGDDASLEQVEIAFNPIESRFEMSTGDEKGAGVVLNVAEAGDTAKLLGFAGVSAYQQGADTETIEDALEAIKQLNDQWYFITLDSRLNDSIVVEKVSAWAAPQAFMFSAESNDPAVLVTGEENSTLARISTLKSQRTFATWSRTDDYKSASIAARFSSVNFSGNNTLITGKFKSLPSTLSDKITPTQQTELLRKNVNYYAPFSGDDIYAEGVTFAPSVYIDVRYWLDWFMNAVQVDVYNLLRQSPTKVPQTKEGIAAIKGVIERVCRQGVNNGGIAAGQLSDALKLDVQQTTRNSDFDGFLPNGYLVYAAPITELSQSDRNQRKVTPFRIWLKGSGAIHNIDIQINFEN